MFNDLPDSLTLQRFGEAIIVFIYLFEQNKCSIQNVSVTNLKHLWSIRKWIYFQNSWNVSCSWIHPRLSLTWKHFSFLMLLFLTSSHTCPELYRSEFWTLSRTDFVQCQIPPNSTVLQGIKPHFLFLLSWNCQQITISKPGYICRSELIISELLVELVLIVGSIYWTLSYTSDLLRKRKEKLTNLNDISRRFYFYS